ncbi:MAG: response regulator [Asticcacaulis sp.]|nr:response regulator [Asticcacaulis sp.]
MTQPDAASETDSLRILLVEDNLGDSLLFRRAMTRAGPKIDVTHASTGEAAMELLENENNQFDLVFLDLNLPKMSGLAVLKRIKSQVYLRGMPVMMLSGSEASDDVKEAYGNFATGYMVKPATPDGYDRIADFVVQSWFGVMKMPVMR